jgi:hypothetical protein
MVVAGPAGGVGVVPGDTVKLPGVESPTGGTTPLSLVAVAVAFPLGDKGEITVGVAVLVGASVAVAVGTGVAVASGMGVAVSV